VSNDPRQGNILPHLEKRIDLNGRLGNTRKGAFGTLTSTPQTSEGTRILRDIKLALPLELVLEVLEECIVEILTTQMSITSSRLDSEDPTGNVEQRNIKSSSTEVENEDVLFRF